ncbi:MAG: hypothetical protein RBS80_00110 [Thermoguttaceae bacterium]|jgi:hypothetical protein|nr:hypothetical protein [Thermoguttaceae bacterium]
MSISVTCPGCSRKYLAKEELAGRTLRCKLCGQSLRVPVPELTFPGPEWEPLPGLHNDDDFWAENLGTAADAKAIGSNTPSDSARTPLLLRPPRRIDGKRATDTVFGSRQLIRGLCVAYVLFLLAGWFVPSVGFILMLAWCFFGIVAAGMGIIWHMSNLFRSNPIDALLTILLPFAGWIYVSTGDLSVPQNERSWQFLCGGIVAVLFGLLGVGFQFAVHGLPPAPNVVTAPPTPSPPPPPFSHRVPEAMPEGWATAAERPRPIDFDQTFPERPPRRVSARRPFEMDHGSPFSERSHLEEPPQSEEDAPSGSFPFTASYSRTIGPFERAREDLERLLRDRVAGYIPDSLTIDVNLAEITVQLSGSPQPAHAHEITRCMRLAGFMTPSAGWR